MPLKSIIERARRDKRQGKSASTQAGEFIREQIDKTRGGVHGAVFAPGDRHWSVGGAPRRRQAAAAEKGPHQSKHAPQRRI